MTDRLEVMTAASSQISASNDLVKHEDRDEEDDHNSSLRSLLECGICNLRYTSLSGPRNPRSTPCCGHTVCETCVAKVLEHASSGVSALCPFCRKPLSFQSATELAVSRVVLQLMELYCGLCLNSVHTGESNRNCSNCGVGLCAVCLRKHRQAGAAQRLSHLNHLKESMIVKSQKAIQLLQEQCTATLKRLDVLREECQLVVAGICNSEGEQLSDMCDTTICDLKDQRVQVMEDLCQRLPQLFSGEVEMVASDVHEENCSVIRGASLLDEDDDEVTSQSLIFRDLDFTNDLYESYDNRISYWNGRHDFFNTATDHDEHLRLLDQVDDETLELPLSAPSWCQLNGEKAWCTTFLPDGRLVVGNPMDLILCRAPRPPCDEGFQRHTDSSLHIEVIKRLPAECRWAVEALSATQTVLVASFNVGAGNTFSGLMSFTLPHLDTLARRSEECDIRSVAADFHTDLLFAAQPDMHRVLVLKLPGLEVVAEIGINWLHSPMCVALVRDSLVVSGDQHITSFSCTPPFTFQSRLPVCVYRLATVFIPLLDKPSLFVMRESFFADILDASTGLRVASINLQDCPFPESRDLAWEVTAHGRLLCFSNPSSSFLVFICLL